MAVALLVAGGFAMLYLPRMFQQRSCPLCGAQREHERFCPFRKAE